MFSETQTVMNVIKHVLPWHPVEWWIKLKIIYFNHMVLHSLQQDVEIILYTFRVQTVVDNFIA